MSLDFSPLDTRITFSELFGTKQGRNGMLIAVAVVIVTFFALYTIFDLKIYPALVLLLPVVTASPYLLYTQLQKAMRSVRLQRFAATNNMQYYNQAVYDGRSGIIFGTGRDKKFVDVIVSGSAHVPFAECGAFQYVTGDGKNRRLHEYGFVRIKLPRTLPHMVLDTRQNNFLGMSNLPSGFHSDQKMSLEGDFDNYFTLYAPAQYKTDALYVFTPDVMAVLIDYAQGFDCEVIDDDFYLYAPRGLNVQNGDAMRSIVGIAEILRKEISEQAHTYADHRIELPKANIVAPAGARLRKRWPMMYIIIFVFVMLFMAYHWFGFIKTMLRLNF